jgi:hypothetical protein
MLLVSVGVILATAGAARAQVDPKGPEIDGGMLTYSKGQPVLPVYEGWHPNQDGTIDLYFGYLNQNYEEEVDVPIGPDNNIGGKWGPDGGQPTHFLPRNNRWVFKVRVPGDFGKNELVWTLTSHGRTYRAYATLIPGYVHDDMGLQREYNGEPPAVGNKAPEITIQGDNHRSAMVGKPITLTIKVADDGYPHVQAPGGGGAAANNNAANARRAANPSICGTDTSPQNCGAPNEGAGNLFSVKGLRMGCFVYRGSAEPVNFEPPQPKMWEDHRGGSPWSTGYTLPPLPKDNTWVIQTTFDEPGNYTVRCLAHDGLLVTPADVTFTVTK